MTLSVREARAFVFAQLRDRFEGVDAVYPEQHLEELLPNTLFSFDGGEPRPLAAGVIVGEVARASAGAAFAQSPGEDSEIEVSFDSRDANWRVLELTIDVQQGWGDFAAGDQMRFGVVIDGATDPEEALAAYRSLGSIVAVLNEQGWFPYDKDLYAVRRSGQLLGTADAGRLAFPALEDADFVGDVETLDDLAVVGRSAPVIIRVDTTGGAYSRS